MENISFRLKELSDNNYKVIVKVPFSIGWIDKMNIILNDNIYQLSHSYNESEYAYFEKDIYLDRVVNHFYFNYIVNGNCYELKDEDRPFKISTHKNPRWYRDRMQYHIFIDSFNKSDDLLLKPIEGRSIHKNWNEKTIIGPNPETGNWCSNYYGGNLKGITNKLDYLCSLGINIIFLSPFVHAQSNHGYDAINHLEVDPYKGSPEDLKKLCDEAHRRGMKVIVDSVFNHTSYENPFFDFYDKYGNGAFNHPDSPYNAYYDIWNRDSNGRGTFNKEGKPNYRTWWEIETLPKAFGPAWEEYITGVGGVIDYWFSLGIDGLRLDVTDELSDEFLRKIINAVKRNKEDGFIIHEVWENYIEKRDSYAEIVDSPMNYYLMDGLINYNKYGNVDKFREHLKKIIDTYPEDVLHCMMNFTSTHDISRIINYYGSNDVFDPNARGYDLYKKYRDNSEIEVQDFLRNYKMSEEEIRKGIDLEMVHLFELCFLPGIISIYYGDEVGLEGLGNIYTRSSFPWNNINYDLFNYYKYIGSIRKDEHDFLSEAGIRIKDINPTYFQFERTTGKDRMLITVNRTNKGTYFLVPPEYEEPDKVYTLKKSKLGYLDAYGGVAIKKKI